MRSKAQRGFTLIELVVGVTIFTVLLTASVATYTTINKLYIKDKIGQEAQRELDSVLANMSLNLKEAVRLDPAAVNGSTNTADLVVRLSNNSLRRYYITGNVLHYVDEAGADQTLLAPSNNVFTYSWQPTSDASGALKQLKITATLTRTKSGTSTTVTGRTTINPRPQ